MTDKNINIFRYAAGGLFAFALVRSLFGVIKNALEWGFDLSFSTVLFWIACALMAVAMFTKQYKLLAVGAGVRAGGLLIGLFSYIGYIFEAVSYGYAGIMEMLYLISDLLFIACYVLLLVAALKKENAAKLSVIAAVLGAVSILLSFIVTLAVGYRFEFTLVLKNIFNIVVNCAPVALAGFAIQGAPKTAPVTVQASQPVAPSTSSQIEKLMKLKELLDSGVLTQEEFDAKKKELLDM